MASKAMYRRTKAALKSLIQNSLDSQTLNTKDRYGNGLAYLNAYCTVRMTGPRQSGHSTAMIQLARTMFEHPIFLYPNTSMANWAAERFGIEAGCAHFLFKERGRTGVDAIFVDGAFAVSHTKEAHIQSLALCYMASQPKFVLAFIQ